MSASVCSWASLPSRHFPVCRAFNSKRLSGTGLEGNEAPPGRANAPMEKPNLKVEVARQQQLQLFPPRTWSKFLVSSILSGNAGEGTERK